MNKISKFFCTLTFALHVPLAVHAAEPATATFAGGCFWCIEHPFDALPGVLETTSGFANGDTPDPTYEQVSAGGTGYYEAVQVKYDPDLVTYETLLRTYWPNVDPVDNKGQFCDRGATYRPAVFYSTPEEKKAAEASKNQAQARIQQEVVVPVIKFTNFYAAEEYHQDYRLKNPTKYKFYRWKCGRDARLDEVWNGIKALPAT